MACCTDVNAHACIAKLNMSSLSRMANFGCVDATSFIHVSTLNILQQVNSLLVLTNTILWRYKHIINMFCVSLHKVEN